MRFRLTTLLLISLLTACQSNRKEQAVTQPTAPDTMLVDDDTLENGSSVVDTTIVAVATLPSAPTATASPGDFYIIPGERVGMITADATEASLKQIIGQTNVTHEPMKLAEGDTEPGTTLFKGTANEVHIRWKDKKRWAKPDAVLIRLARNNQQATAVQPRWLVDNGLKIGSTLKEVEKVNGKSFTLYGFGGDRAGSVSNVQGGKLRGPDGKLYLSLTLGLKPLVPAQEKLARSVSGDREFSSALPALQKLNPTVEAMLIRFR